MPANTPILALPYPVPADTVDVPRDVQALATKLDTFSAIKPPVVAALPGAPIDGQEIFYLANDASGVLWHLRYRATSASAYKWEFVGGGDLAVSYNGPDSTTSTTYVDLPGGPSLAIPLAGDYIVSFGATVECTLPNRLLIGVKPGSAAIDDGAISASHATSPSGGAAEGPSIAATVRYNARAAGDILKMQCRVAVANGGTFSKRWIFVHPGRVG